MSDGNLRALFAKNIPGDWTSIETWSTGRGVPDANFCINGIEGWVEFKACTGWRVGMRAEQVGWIERRIRHGGRCFIAVRRKIGAGPRRGAAVDHLYLFHGQQARKLLAESMVPFDEVYKPLGFWFDGPKAWNWTQVIDIITK